MKFFQLLTFTCILTVLSCATTKNFAQKIKAKAPTEELRATQKQYHLDPNSSWLSRVAKTPDDIIKMFIDAGISPTEHKLSTKEINIISQAFATLPPLHQQVLRQHLKSVSFLDNMPNTALTSPVTNNNGANLYHITFRAGILRQTISDWVTEKERTCYSGGDSTISVSIQAGLLSALTYVLLHESTHVLDGALQLMSTDTIAGKPRLSKFTAGFSKGIWKNSNKHYWLFKDSTVVKNRFRPGGRLFVPNEATKVYEGLSQTPFVSLYSTASWHEDLAELLTVYHLTKRYKQPFRIVVRQYGKEIFQYEPMKSALVLKRISLLNCFYTKNV